MKIRILTEGGQNIGYGHLSRCSALYDAAKNMNYDATLYIHGMEYVPNFLSDYQTVFVDWLHIESLKAIIEPEDYVIVDSYLARYEILEYIALLAKKVLYIDDTHRLDYPSGIVINPTPKFDDNLYPKSTNTTYIWGKDYIILRTPFQYALRKKINRTAKKILVMIGGTDPLDITTTIVKSLCVKHTYFHFDIVKNYSEEDLKCFTTKNIIFHRNLNAEQVKDLMLNADFAISAAGQTIYELIATKTPFIPIQTAKNQDYNVAFLKSHGIITQAIRPNDQNLIDLLIQKFDMHLKYEIRLHQHQKFERLINKKGNENIVNQLINTNNKNHLIFRHAEKSDCDLLFYWASDKLARKNAFNPKKIKYEDHVNWFHQKMKDKNTQIYIAMCNNKPIGSIRIDVNDQIGLISYSVDNQNRGKGYGKKILNLVEESTKNDFPTIYKLIGNVKYDNVASRKSFIHNQYSEEKKEDYIRYTKTIKG